MPYYPQQYGWGEALAQWGNTLSRWGQRKEEEAMNRLKNRYGNNVEAWRQDALKNPQGEEAKYYKKFVGDPSQNLPEDPQMAQQREIMKQQAAVWEAMMNDPNIPEETKQTMRVARGLQAAGIGATGMEPILRGIGKKNIDPAKEQELDYKIDQQYPNATALQKEEYKNTLKTGENPWQTVYTQGQVNPESPYSVFSPPVYDMKSEQVSPAILKERMGKTSAQVKMEDAAAKRKMAEEKFAELKTYRDEVNQRFERNFRTQQARWNESQKYKMTPEERLQFNATMKALNQSYAMLNKDRDAANKEVARLEADIARLKSQKAMLPEGGGEYAAQVDATINELNTNLTAARNKLSDVNMKLDQLESNTPNKKSVKEQPDTGGGTDFDALMPGRR